MARRPKPLSWTNKSGEPISYKRDIEPRRRLIIGMIKKFFPLMRFDEPSMTLDDLLQECNKEAMMALMNFDPVMALTAVTKQEGRKRRSDEDHLKWKSENPEAALELAKDQWISRRLYNFLRRIRHERGTTKAGGRTVSYAAILAKTNKVLDFEGVQRGGIFSPEDEARDALSSVGAEDHSLGFVTLDTDQAASDSDRLTDLLEVQGLPAMQAELRRMEKEEPARYINLQEYLEQVAVARATSYSGFETAAAEEQKDSAEDSDDDAA